VALVFFQNNSHDFKAESFCTLIAGFARILAQNV